MTRPVSRIEKNKELVINEGVSIPLAELQFRFIPSSGPGGQHVNRSATQAVLEFDLGRSPFLSEKQKDLIRTQWKSYIDKDDIVHLSSQTFRSQIRNREDVTSRFVVMLRRALHIAKPRRPSKPTPASREKRLTQKSMHGTLKKNRKLDASDIS